MMFERLFQWSFRNGSRILFGIALVTLTLQICAAITVLITYSVSAGHIPWRRFILALVAVLQPSIWLFVAALVVEKLRLEPDRVESVGTPKVQQI